MLPTRSNPQGPISPPTLVEDARGFEALLDALAEADEIAVDTEADSFYRYRERVCLVQITVGEEDYLVDPLAGFDVSGLGAVFADPARIKVFHDGEYDVLILKREYDFRFAGLFDTRIAAAALGFESPGLASVVGTRFGIELDKSQQRSDWSRRPLTESQIAYARQDTRYLLALMRELRCELEERDRLAIVEGECRRLEGLEPTPRSFNPDEFIRLKGARMLDAHQMGALRELYVMRDELARERDVPPFKVLGNAPLVELARARPRTRSQIERLDGLSPRMARRLGNPIQDALRRAEERGPLESVPRLPPRDPGARMGEKEIELHDRLKTWRRQRAVEQGMDSSLVLNRHVLVRFAQARPRTRAELFAVEGLLEWQIELFGVDLLELVESFERDLAQGRVELRGRRGRGRRSGEGR